MEGDDLVLLEEDRNTGILTLNRPERHNSLTVEFLSALRRKLLILRDDTDIDAILLQANGHSFSTGGDVSQFYEKIDQGLKEYASTLLEELNEIILELLSFPVPVVSAIHGIVTGGSIGLVLASDIVLVTSEASFTPYYTVVGYSPDGGWTAILPEIIGRRRTAEIIITNKTITCEEALNWGIATRKVSDNQIRSEARNIASKISQMKRSSIRRTRYLLQSNIDLATKLDREKEQFLKQIVTAEARKGMRQFLKDE